MIDGIDVRVLGDYGPFSRMGKSIGYQVTIGKSSYLVDCGSPLFQQIGGHAIKAVKGLIVTHCHDDHKRWYSDLALFYRYAPDLSKKIFLLTSEEIYKELYRASGPALDRSLSSDSKTIVDIAHESYFDHRILGPRAKYQIVSKNDGCGKSTLFVSDREGNPTPPDVAKIIVSIKTGRARMLFKDPDYEEWVEPESFYSFSSGVFYEEDKHVYQDPEGFSIEAINAPVWHGIPGIGLRFRTRKESLVFSSDTAHDVELWKQLYSEKRPRRSPLTYREFEAASVIYGDINDYIERTWSEERFTDAVNAFRDSVVIHDIAVRNSIVHTDYRKLKNTVLKRGSTILTHSPDTMTSQWMLSDTEKRFRIKEGAFYEIVGDSLYPCDADIYHKEGGRRYVGYKSSEGKYSVYENDGLLGISRGNGQNHNTALFNVDLYEDITGKYFPKLEDGCLVYRERGDGQVELVEFTGGGSAGKVVENRRGKLAEAIPARHISLRAKRS